jgi:hypothetical protein
VAGTTFEIRLSAALVADESPRYFLPRLKS